MTTMEKLKRYIIFFIGLYINSLGVALITKASLGTSPISSIPYVLSLNFPFTLGNFTIFFSLFLIFLQLLILRKNFKLEHILQIPVSILFGYFIDWSMILFSFVHPQMYLMKVFYLLLGCLILGFGVYTEVLANVVMLPGESFVRAVTLTWKTEFGITKICFDVSMTIIAALLSFLFAHHLDGVREGTIVSALLVGFIARLFGRFLSFLEPALFPSSAESTESIDSSSLPVVIAIAREYGSGGHELGEKLAKRLNFDFYDNEIIQMAAGSTGYDPEFIKNNDEQMRNRLFYDLLNQVYSHSAKTPAPKDQIFAEETKVIKKLASKGNCVIMGRCADYTLRERAHCMKIFLHAPAQYRIDRIMKTEHLTYEDAKSKILQMNQKRSDNYHYYTHQPWGLARNYHLTLDTSMGEDYVLNTICEGLKNI